jgi:hypothetical protein
MKKHAKWKIRKGFKNKRNSPTLKNPGFKIPFIVPAKTIMNPN